LAARNAGHPDLDQQFVRGERHFEEAEEEILGVDLTSSVRTLRDERAPQRQHHGGQVGRRVTVSDRTSDGAAVANLRVTDLTGHVREHRSAFERRGTGGDVVVTGEGANSHVPVLILHVAEFAQRPDIDEQGRLSQTHFHEREK
jgi:hypothetical protein